MTLIWKNPASNNRFETKHLYILKGAASVDDLVREGSRIFDERIKASKGNKVLKAKYGGTKPSANTLIVLSIGGFKQLELNIQANGYAAGWYDIPTGALFDVDATSYVVGTAGRVRLSIRAVTGQPATYEVWHLDGMQITKRLNVSQNAERQLKTQSFVPKVGDLQAASQSLNHVTTNVKGGIEVGRPVHLFSAAQLRLAAIRARELDEADDA